MSPAAARDVGDVGAIDPRMAAAQPLFAARRQIDDGRRSSELTIVAHSTIAAPCESRSAPIMPASC